MDNIISKIADILFRRPRLLNRLVRIGSFTRAVLLVIFAMSGTALLFDFLEWVNLGNHNDQIKLLCVGSFSVFALFVVPKMYRMLSRPYPGMDSPIKS